MGKSALTGSRIRDRRQALRIKQSQLAQLAGISASYLNLIEHNRRKIGGKVLIHIARALDVDVTTLTEGAEEALLDGLREAAAEPQSDEAEVDRIEEFVARFPGWARLVDRQRRQIEQHARTIEALNDRLTHDPFLSDAMHDLVSNVTAIRSTAGILAQTPEIEPAWRDRFHKNLDEESERLSRGSEALIKFFEAQDRDKALSATNTPLEALEALLVDTGYHFPSLETGGIDAAETLAASSPQLATDQARHFALEYFAQYIEDAEALPKQALIERLKSERDPATLAMEFGVPLPQTMRRLATLPAEELGYEIGLVVSDASGALLHRKAIDGFPVPRFGPACALWPIFRALHQPNEPHKAEVETHTGRRFLTYACAASHTRPTFESAPAWRASMLIIELREAVSSGSTPLPVGMNCRTCARTECAVRREPSLMEV